MNIINGTKHLGYNAEQKSFKELEDKKGHGTFIAGILSALQNNEGGQGSVFKSKLMNVKAFGKGADSALCNALFFAVKNKANIINCSWGPRYHRSDIRILKDAINYAYHRKVLCVFAAGNHGNDVSQYCPMNDPRVITVGAVGKNNRLWGKSNFGKGIDVLAPGEKILSLGLKKKALLKSGTSYAAPQVTGVLALIIGFFKDIRDDHFTDHQLFLDNIKNLLRDDPPHNSTVYVESNDEPNIISYDPLNEKARMLDAVELYNKAKRLY